MTLVAGLVAPSFGILVADKRRSNLETGERLDDVLKMRRLNNRVAIGYSGSYYVSLDGRIVGSAEQIIEQLEQQTRDPRCTVESVVHIYSKNLRSLIEQGIAKEQLQMSFHIIGKSVTGSFALGRVSVHEDFEPVITWPQPLGLIWGLSRAEYCPTDWLVAQIASLPEITPDSVQRLAMRLIEHTAERDGYVSGKYNMLTLE